MRMEVKDDCASGAEAKARMLAAHRRRREMLRPARHLPSSLMPVMTKAGARPAVVKAKVPDAVASRLVPDAIVSRPSWWGRYLEPTWHPMPVECDDPSWPDPVLPVDRAADAMHVRCAAAEYFGISEAKLISDRRSHPDVLWRQIGMYVCCRITRRGLAHIGRVFGNRDHTTVINAKRKIDALIKSGEHPDVLGDVEEIERRATAYMEEGIGFFLRAKGGNQSKDSQPQVTRPAQPNRHSIAAVLQATATHYDIPQARFASPRCDEALRWRGVLVHVARSCGVNWTALCAALGRSPRSLRHALDSTDDEIRVGHPRTVADVAAIRQLLEAYGRSDDRDRATASDSLS